MTANLLKDHVPDAEMLDTGHRGSTSKEECVPDDPALVARVGLRCVLPVPDGKLQPTPGSAM